MGEFEGLRVRYKELGKAVCDRFGVSVLAPVCGGSIAPTSSPQLQTERSEHEATKEQLLREEEEHDKLRSSACSGGSGEAW